MTILIVDDNEANLYQLQVLLGGNGYQIVTAENGADALARARQTPPDLIVSDILMPVMDGFTLCREWRKDERLCRIPFVFYTATYTDDRDREFALSLGARQFLVKPEEPDVFLREIREAIQDVQHSPAAPSPAPGKEPPKEEFDYLKQYNQTLVRKLEAKMQQLEQSNRELEQGLTERKNMEQQLLQVQKLESVGRLAGGIAHDFNNILSVIMGYSEIALLRMEKDSPARASIEGVKSAVQRAAALTGQLLVFSRKQVSQAQVVVLNDVVRGFQKMLERLIGEDISIETHLSEGLWPVRVDPHQIEQVLMNLSVNARDAMPSGGTLLFESCNLGVADAVREPHLLSSGDYVMLKVGDTGCGIPEAAKVHIFDPFFTTKVVGKGTGLGLSVVYGVIKQAGGSIRFESSEGAGTSFFIYLPRELASPQTVHPEELDVRTLHGTESILLVDDEASICEIVRMTLEEHGYRVFATSDPAQALNWLSGASVVDALVTDVVMPDMSGIELAQRVVAQRPRTRVLLMSGYATDANGASIVEKAHPAWGRVEKPFNPQALTAAIRALLDGKAVPKLDRSRDGSA